MPSPFHKIKIAAAALLLVAFFSPISSCTYTVPLDPGAQGNGAAPDGARVEEKAVTFRASEYLHLKEAASWLNLLAFTWPFLLVGLQLKWSGPRAAIILPSAGVLLSLMSAAVVTAWAGAGKPLIGAWAGWLASASLLAVFLVELAGGMKKGSGHVSGA